MTTDETINKIADKWAKHVSFLLSEQARTRHLFEHAIIEATEALCHKMDQMRVAAGVAIQEELVLRQELAELRKDKERLDWLSTKALYHSVPSFWYNNVEQTLREAIDAAMGKDKK